MPIGPTSTKAQRAKVVHTEMRKFKHGTLHSGSKHGPKVTNPKQAIAIALSESRGGKPKAPPIGAGESRGSYDRSAHFKGNPGFAEGRHVPHQSFAAEQREHWGNQAKGKSMSDEKVQANVGHEKRGSELVGEVKTSAAKQPRGNPIGTGHGRAEHHGEALGGERAPHKFDRPPAKEAHSFGHAAHQRAGHHRNSGHSGAHRIGKR